MTCRLIDGLRPPVGLNCVRTFVLSPMFSTSCVHRNDPNDRRSGFGVPSLIHKIARSRREARGH